MADALAYDIDEVLKLDNQLCFPLWAAAKEVVRSYTPFLEALDLTYTQYIALMALWERDGIGVRELGERLYLDSGTLTPLLKKLEVKGLITRTRSSADERAVIVKLTEQGRALKSKAARVPAQIASCVDLTLEEGMQLVGLLHKILHANKASGESAA